MPPINSKRELVQGRDRSMRRSIRGWVNTEKWRKSLLVSLCLIPSIARAGLVDRVLVIRNMNSPVSQAVANDYMVRRGATHVLDIRVPDAAASIANETILFPEFQISIEKPLKGYLFSHPGIDFI